MCFVCVGSQTAGEAVCVLCVGSQTAGEAGRGAAPRGGPGPL